MKKSKKGFTIVELVIVIAVIAILAAVLIPTFSNVIDKANKSAAEQAVTNAVKMLIAEQKDAELDNDTYFDYEGKTYSYKKGVIKAEAIPTLEKYESKAYKATNDTKFLEDKKYYKLKSGSTTEYEEATVEVGEDVTASTYFEQYEKAGYKKATSNKLTIYMHTSDLAEVDANAPSYTFNEYK